MGAGITHTVHRDLTPADCAGRRRHDLLLEGRHEREGLHDRAWQGGGLEQVVALPHRGLRPVEGEVPAYPVQNRLTRELRVVGGRLGDSEVLSLWAGQAVSLTRAGPAAELVQAWWEEAKQVSADLYQRTHGPYGDRR